MSDYLTKPVNPVLLKARLGASIAERRLRELELRIVADATAALVSSTAALEQLAAGKGPVADLARSVLLALVRREDTVTAAS